METSSAGGHAASSTTRTTIRYFIKLAEPRWPFMPWGILPLFGLLALLSFGFSSFAQNWIQRVVHEQTRTKLDAAGLNWVKVDVSGQQVALSGEEPKAGDGDRALALANAAECPTFAGDYPCAISVEGNFSKPSGKLPAAVPTAGPATGIWPDYTFALVAGELVLRGQVPDEATRSRVVARAKALFHAPEFAQVKDELTLAKEPVRDGYEGALLRGVETVSACVHGTSALTKETFSLHCEVHQDQESKIRSAASAALAGGKIGDISLQVKEQADSCEKDFAAALSKSTIEFDTSSSTIRATSNALLDALAAIALRCPGELSVDGHTDDRGKLDENMKLSRDRAESVVRALAARKVEVARLKANGFGPTKPTGDNATEAGRSQNRRIEFHIVRQ